MSHGSIDFSVSEPEKVNHKIKCFLLADTDATPLCSVDSWDATEPCPVYIHICQNKHNNGVT